MAPSGKPPRLSVIMPVRDGERYLPAAVESILEQSFGDFEFLVVEDGSQDGAPSILEDYRKRDRRLKVLATGGQGIVPALNLGLANARAALVARMDGDDVALPGRFAAQFSTLERDPDLIVLGTAAVTIGARGQAQARLAMPLTKEQARTELRHRNPILHPTVMMRREAVAAVGGYRAALSYAEDYDLWLRLAKKGGIANLAEPLMKLRRHSGQTSATRRLEQRAAAALARLLAAGTGPSTAVDTGKSLHEALTRVVASLLDDAAEFPAENAGELAVILRAASRARLLDRAELRMVGRRIAREGRLPSGWLLPIKLWLGR